MAAEYKTKDGQSIFDVALQLYGDISFCIKIMQENPDVLPNINTKLTSGTIIKYTPTLNNEVVDKFNKVSYIVNTSEPPNAISGGYDSGFVLTSFF